MLTKNDKEEKKMRLKKCVFLFLLMPFFAGCQSLPNQGSSVVILEKPSYPILEEVEIPEEPSLIPMNVDLPRREYNEEYQSECSAISGIEEKKEECKKSGIVFDTNLYVGFDLKNWENLQINLIRIREYSYSLRKILEEINMRIREIKEDETRETEEFNKTYAELLKETNK